MSFTVACGSCKAKLKVPDKSAGKTVPCPKCGMPLLLPADNSGNALRHAPPLPSRDSTAATVPPSVDTDAFLYITAARPVANQTNQRRNKRFLLCGLTGLGLLLIGVAFGLWFDNRIDTPKVEQVSRTPVNSSSGGVTGSGGMKSDSVALPSKSVANLEGEPNDGKPRIENVWDSGEDPIKMAPSEVFSRNNANGTQTAKQFNGKLFEVSGLVTDVVADVVSDPPNTLTFIFIADKPGSPLGISATLQQEFSENLRKSWVGKNITVRGRFHGDPLGVKLFPCVVLGMSDTPSPSVRSVDSKNSLDARPEEDIRNATKLIAPPMQENKATKDIIEFESQIWELADNEFKFRDSRSKVFYSEFDQTDQETLGDLGWFFARNFIASPGKYDFENGDCVLAPMLWSEYYKEFTSADSTIPATQSSCTLIMHFKVDSETAKKWRDSFDHQNLTIKVWYRFRRVVNSERDTNPHFPTSQKPIYNIVFEVDVLKIE